MSRSPDPARPAPTLTARAAGYLRSFGGFHRDARRFLVAALLAGAAISLFFIDFNLYLSALGFDRPTIGLISTVGNLAGLIAAFPASRLADLVGRRSVLIGSNVVAGAALAAMALATDVVTITALDFVFQAALTSFFVVQNPFLMEHSDADHRSELFTAAFAIENVTNVLAAVIGGAAAAALATIFGFDASGPVPFRILLAGMAMMMLGSVPLLLRIRDDRPAGEEGRRRLGLRRPSLARLRPRRPAFSITGDRRTYLRLLLPSFLIGCGAGQVIPFLNLFVERRFGLDITQVNAVFAVTSIGSILALLGQPLLARRVGKVASVVIVQGASIPFLVVLGFSPLLWTVVVAIAIRASLMNAGNPISNAFAMEVVHPDDRAGFSAAQSVLWSLAWTLAAPYYSLVQAAFGFDLGYTVNFLTVITLYCIAIAVYWRWFGGVERRRAAEVVEAGGAEAGGAEAGASPGATG